jgi:predicted secreted hydrolase
MFAIALLASACVTPPATPLPTPPPRPTVTYPPVQLPRDEAPHSDLTEWWYYTGHLDAPDGRTWGFQLVFFQALRGSLPPFYVGHFAVTDVGRATFTHDQRGTRGVQPQPDHGFALTVDEWKMAGVLGRDALQATLPNYSIDLRLSTDRPPVLHDGGLVSFGPAGDSYYYSRTRMAVDGLFVAHGESIPVRGEAWFDHQWGNFLVLGGGWDWFSIHLDDGTDLMVNLIRDADGVVRIAYGTHVAADGSYRHLPAEAVHVTPRRLWPSPRSGATYPMGWQVVVRDPEVTLELEPAVEDQELDTTRTTGMIYWEGAVRARGSTGGKPVFGRGYVEMTGYATSRPLTTLQPSDDRPGRR